MNDVPKILLINPWIHDFAAYDFWAKPIGLLRLGAILRSNGFTVSYIDCTDRFHPKAPVSDPATRNGRGPYLKTRIPKPKGLDDVPRRFSRYGIRPEWFVDDLKAVPKPDLVLVTSLMTYWYPGVRESIRLIREIFFDVPIVLGGIYATLCESHAKAVCGADEVISGCDERNVMKRISEFVGFTCSQDNDLESLDTVPYPAFDLQNVVSYIPIMTSKGCPFSCAYCASRILNPQYITRSPESVVEEIRYWHQKYNVRDFVFYDDALLVDAEHHAAPLIEGIIRAELRVRFHTPNAVHIRGITRQIAELMFKAGFKTLRLGLETTAFENRAELDRKVTELEFCEAVRLLKSVGFDRDHVGAYLLAGLPGQSWESVEHSIEIVKQSGITPIPAYYSPIPGTALWAKAKASSRYDLENDPVFTNNAVLPCRQEPFSWELITRLKKHSSQHEWGE